MIDNLQGHEAEKPAATVERLRADLAAAEAALEAAERVQRDEQLERLKAAQSAELERLQGRLNAALTEGASRAADVLPLLAATRDAIEAAAAAQAEAVEAAAEAHFIREHQRIGPAGGAMHPFPPGIPDPLAEVVARYPVVSAIRDLSV